MNDYVFMLSKEMDCDVVRKAVYFNELDDHLSDGWVFNNPSDKTYYRALYCFYEAMKDDRHYCNS